MTPAGRKMLDAVKNAVASLRAAQGAAIDAGGLDFTVVTAIATAIEELELAKDLLVRDMILSLAAKEKGGYYSQAEPRPKKKARSSVSPDADTPLPGEIVHQGRHWKFRKAE